MSTTSADPSRLDHFVATTAPGRLATADATQAAHALTRDVLAQSAGRGVSGSSLAAVDTLLANMHGAERFVAGVAEALRSADTSSVGGGPLTVGDAAIVALLAAHGADLEVAPITIGPLTLLGEPANSGLVDDPICAANGNFVHVDTDLTFPGTSATLDLRRTYNSLAADRIGSFGAGWSSLLDVRLVITDERVEARLADGAELTFTPHGGHWTTSDRRYHRLIANGEGWTMTTAPVAGMSFAFDARGQLVGWERRRSRVWVRRDDLGRPVRLDQSPSGRWVAIEWRHDRVAGVSTDDGRHIGYRYAGDTLTRAESASGWLDYRYAGRLMTAAIDPDGVTQFVNRYDTDGRVIEQTSPFGRVTSYRYTIPGATVITDERGVRQAMVHDGRGNLTTVIDHDGSAMRIEYDEHDRAVQVSSPSGATWRHAFHAATGDLTQRIDPDLLGQSWEYDSLGRVVATTDRAGGITHFEFDADHSTPSRVIGPDGAIASAVVDARDLPLTIVDTDGTTTDYEWDADGQATRISIEAAGHHRVVTAEYDAGGLATMIDDGGEAITRFAYDDARRLSTITTGGVERRFTHTAGGRTIGGVEPNGHAWAAEFGAHGARTAWRDATGAETGFAYDTHGNVVAVTAPDGAVHRREYDAVGRLVAATRPGGVTSRFEYGADGHLVQLTDPAGRVWRRSVDGLGRTVTSTAPDGVVTRWSHHPLGGVRSVRLPDGRTVTTDAGGGRDQIPAPLTVPPVGWLRFDERRLLAAAAEQAGAVTTYRYDLCGRLVSATAAGGRTTTWEYADSGYVSRITDPAGVTTLLERDPTGIVVALHRGDDGWTRTLDAAGRELERRALDGTLLAGFEYDACGRIVAGRTDRSSTRLDAATTAVIDGGMLAHPDGTVFRHDAAGRLVEISPPGAPATTFEFGDDGLLASERGAAGERRFRYDIAGRVVAIDLPGGGTTEICYDASGRRASELEPDGSLTTYRWDALDRVTAITRAAPDSTVTATTVEYDAFGRPNRIDGDPVDFPPLTPVPLGSLRLLGARLADPATHQFLTPDPLMTVPGSNGSASAYTYCWYDPVGFADPTGLRPISIAEYQAIREREEQGRLGQAWQAIEDDPWGTLASELVLCAGVALMFTPASGIGVMIVVGAGTTALQGIASGDLDPRLVALSGVAAGVGGAVAGETTPIVTRLLSGGVLNAGETASAQVLTGQPIDIGDIAASGVAGVVTAGVDVRLATPTGVGRAAVNGAVTDLAGSVTEQTLTGANPINVATVVGAAGGGTGNSLTHHFFPSQEHPFRGIAGR